MNEKDQNLNTSSTDNLENETTITENKVSEEKADNHEQDFLELLDESLGNLKKGQIVKGTIVKVNDSQVLVDVGFKSEGVLSIKEFNYDETPEENQEIEVFIDAIEGQDGKVRISKKKADFQKSIDKITEAFDNKEVVKGTLVRRVKGGMIAEIMGVEAFLPGSQISLKPIPNLDQFIGKEQRFLIISINEKRRNIIVSRKVVLEEEKSGLKKELLEKLAEGIELEGEVKNITDYGAFVDLGGIDGLLHITDMSWGRLRHPSDMLNIGDKVKVKVISFDKEKEKVSLGMKQLVPHPWDNIETKYPEGSKISGVVVRLEKYGAFVEIEPGVDGLIHVSEMSWTKRITNPKQVLKEGTKVEAIVLSIDKEEFRISLGLKQMKPNPWLTIDDRYPEGTLLTRKIKNITPFGAFVEIEDDIDGLIHISDISWTKRIYHPHEVFKIGQDVECKVLSIDKTLHRIALGVKQLKNDPWEALEEKLPINTEIEGSVCKIIPKGYLVDIFVDKTRVEGFVPYSHLELINVMNQELAVQVGDKLPLKVIELDLDNRRLILSVKAYFFGKDGSELEKYHAELAEKVKERTAELDEKKEDEKKTSENSQEKKVEETEVKEETEEKKEIPEKE